MAKLASFFNVCSIKSLELHLGERSISEDEMNAYLTSYVESHGKSYPCNIGEEFDEETKTNMLLYLVSNIVPVH